MECSEFLKRCAVLRKLVAANYFFASKSERDHGFAIASCAPQTLSKTQQSAQPKLAFITREKGLSTAVSVAW